MAESDKRQKWCPYSVLGKKRPLAAKEEEEREKADWEQVYSYEEKMLKSRLDTQGYANWEKQHRSWELQNGLVPTVEDWEEEYSFEEKRLKSLVDREGYYRWAKQNWLWERDNNRVPEVSPEDDMRQKEVRFLLSSLSLQDPKKAVEEFDNSQPTQGCNSSTRVLSREEERQKLAASREEERGKLTAQGRCLDGSYLTPHCKCNRKCYQFKTALEDHPPEFLPIWLAYCRQFRQSHCFDIDDFIGGRVVPLTPSPDFEGRAESMMELANRAIQEYNQKECNVFKYKVLKIEKANCSVAMYNTYWMTVTVLNLTLGTPMETFQIHASTSCVNNDKVIYCCRPKEEVIIGLPSCEFCFGLLPEGRVTEGKEP